MKNPDGIVCILNRGEILWELAQWMRTLPPTVQTIGPKGNSIPRQRNLGIHNTGGAWVLFVDSDCLPPPGALAQLLSWDVEVVGGVVLERFPPNRVAAMRSMDPPARWNLHELPVRGIEPVPAMGTGCLLVRRSVFERIDYPWFRCGQVPKNPDLLLEDFEFGLRIKAQANIQTFLDCGLRVAHHVEGMLWPGRDGRPWMQWDGGAMEKREPLEDILALGEVAWA